MKKRNILIIIILTIILAIVSITTLQKKPDIENIYLSSSKDSSLNELSQYNHNYFNSRNSNIYLIINVKHLTTEDEIRVEWEKIEDNSNEIIQSNTVKPEQKGSGKIIILLVKKNGIYSPGSYNVKVYLNRDNKISEKFYILR
jgi:hypothetical protein